MSRSTEIAQQLRTDLHLPDRALELPDRAVLAPVPGLEDRPLPGEDVSLPLFGLSASSGPRIDDGHRLAYQLGPLVSEVPEGRAVDIPDHGHASRRDLQLKYAVPGLLEEHAKLLLALA